MIGDIGLILMVAGLFVLFGNKKAVVVYQLIQFQNHMMYQMEPDAPCKGAVGLQIGMVHVVLIVMTVIYLVYQNVERIR